MRRGEIWTVAGSKDYAGEPRPALVLQDDPFDATDPLRSASITTDPPEAPLFRILIAPSERNGLNTLSRLMVDKITTVPKNKLGHRIGHLDAKDMVRVNQAIQFFLVWVDNKTAQGDDAQVL